MGVDKVSQVDGIDVALGVKNCMDDENLYLSIVEMFVTQLKQNVVELQQQFDAADWSTYGKTCHAIKGAAASVGAVKIQQNSATLEAAGKAGNGGDIQSAHAQYLELLTSTFQALEA